MRSVRELPVRERTAAVFVAVVCGVLVTGGVLSLTLEKPTTSEVEKRRLAQVPELTRGAYLSGRFTRGLSIHFADTFPFRETFLKYHHLFDEWKGHQYEDMKLYFSDPGDRPEDEEWEEPEPPDGGGGHPEARPSTPGDAPPANMGSGQPGPRPGRDGATPPGKEPPPKEPAPEHRRVEKLGNVVVLGDAAFYLYGGSTRVADQYVEVVNRAARILEGRARVYCLPVPTAVELHLPDKYRSLNRSQREIMRHVFAGLRKVTAVDVYEDLATHRDEYLFFRTDHHWTSLGAYHAYEGFARTLGYVANPMSAYRELDFGKFWGTLYGGTRNSALARHPDLVKAYEPPGRYSVTNFNSAGRSTGEGDIIFEGARKFGDKYMAFLQGDLPYIRIVNEGKPRRPVKLLVLKESFGNIFVPWLAPDFAELHVGDIRTFPFGLASFVAERGINEVLFINNLFAVSDKSRIREIRRIVDHP